MATAAQGQNISSVGSTATLDLKHMISSCPSENILSVASSLNLLPPSGSTHSFDNVPPFPLTAKPLIFFADLGPCLRDAALPSSPSTHASSNSSTPLTTSPTGPRMRAMLMECVSVEAWTVSIPPRVHDPPSNEDLTSDFPTWMPEGSLFSPQNFSALFRRHLNARDHDDLTLAVSDAGVPTIMVSNSTAALPLSLSYHSLHRDAPLAVRRGKKPPPALALGQPLKQLTSRDSYPDIPTPFLGSPTACTPITGDCSQASSNFDMGLTAMCADLRSRLPLPPPFSPTEPLPPLPTGPIGLSDVPLTTEDSVATNLDEEEWAFAKELVSDWYGGKVSASEISPPPSPAGDLPYTSDSPTESVFPATPVDPGHGVADAVVGLPGHTPAAVKLTRRRTVIIQAPDASLGKTMATTEKVLAIIADDPGVDLAARDFDEPVPFETPTPARGSTDSVQLAGARPASTASMRPVRSILKKAGKKSVRFSTVDLFHEYTLQGQAGAPASLGSSGGVAPAFLVPDSAPASLLAEPAARTRPATMTATVHRSSPLRQSCTSLTPPAGDRPRPHSTAARPLLDASLFPGGTMARHPAVRAMVRTPSPSPLSALSSSPTPSPAGPMTPCPVRGAGAGPDRAVVGAPHLHTPSPSGCPTPTPTLLKAQRRAPLRSINAQQSMPVEREPEVLIPVKPASAPRRSMLPQGSPAARAAPTPASVRRVGGKAGSGPVAHERDENARRRASVGAAVRTPAAPSSPGGRGRGRVSGSLRSIFTKLRT
ncbi:hypothetical protein BD413DRAFT_606149 [Trametes elegans]|nr:hypothetical protein BD413DRAFT_606149 [Trametes elegans]